MKTHFVTVSSSFQSGGPSDGAWKQGDPARDVTLAVHDGVLLPAAGTGIYIKDTLYVTTGAPCINLDAGQIVVNVSPVHG